MTTPLQRVREALGKPFHEASGVLLYQGDCIELMRALPSGVVDLTVTSPPYNIGKEYESPLSLDEYLSWSEDWMKQVFEASTSTASFWLNLGYVSVPGKGRAVPLPYLLWDRNPFFLHQEVVWHYGAGVASKRAFSPRNEKFLWYLKDPDAYYFDLDSVRDPNVKYPNQKKNGKLKCNPLGKNPTDVWEFPKVTSGTGRSSKERTPHPAQFPEAVIDRIVRGCSSASGLVLDPFMGSGTTAQVAVSQGRDVVGFEMRGDYCELAVRRIENQLAANRQSRLDLGLP
jgi:adenine-specific DNA-methyltransferase